MTEDQFQVLWDCCPKDDDMERVNCSITGTYGHYQCGICPKHKKPRFMCGCIIERKIIRENTTQSA